MSLGKFVLDITGPTTAYLKLPTYPDALKFARSVPLNDLIGAYDGPYVVFDFDQQGTLVGIEVVGDDEVGEDTSEQPEPGEPQVE
ncbi:MAG: hypothetical protein R3B70_35230 [Polyangiaceae bacterium]